MPQIISQNICNNIKPIYIFICIVSDVIDERHDINEFEEFAEYKRIYENDGLICLNHKTYYSMFGIDYEKLLTNSNKSNSSMKSILSKLAQQN